MASTLYVTAYDLLGYLFSQRSCREFHSAIVSPPLVFDSKAQMTRQGHTPQDDILSYESEARSSTETRKHGVSSCQLVSGTGGHDD